MKSTYAQIFVLSSATPQCLNRLFLLYPLLPTRPFLLSLEFRVRKWTLISPPLPFCGSNYCADLLQDRINGLQFNSRLRCWPGVLFYLKLDFQLFPTFLKSPTMTPTLSFLLEKSNNPRETGPTRIVFQPSTHSQIHIGPQNSKLIFYFPAPKFR